MKRERRLKGKDIRQNRPNYRKIKGTKRFRGSKKDIHKFKIKNIKTKEYEKVK